MNAPFRAGSGQSRHSPLVGIRPKRKEKWGPPMMFRAIRVVFSMLHFAVAIPACAAPILGQ